VPRRLARQLHDQVSSVNRTITSLVSSGLPAGARQRARSLGARRLAFHAPRCGALES
jgi:hypothetical protein